MAAVLNTYNSFMLKRLSSNLHEAIRLSSLVSATLILRIIGMPENSRIMLE